MIHYNYNSSFEGILARIYDSYFWGEDSLIVKNVDYITDLINGYGSNDLRKIGDIGCGTGVYCAELAKRDYDVVGIDISEDMIGEAKAKRSCNNVSYKVQDICAGPLEEEVDAVISMAHVIGYQHTNEKLHLFLSNINKSVKSGGLFLFNFYHMPALYLGGLEPRIKTVSVNDELITRYSMAKLSPMDNTLNLHYNYLLEESGKIASITIDEKMRYFTTLEMEYALRVNGFELLGFVNYLTNDILDESQWNGMCIARKV